MENIVLYCKSYHRDLGRASRLADSIRRFNSSNIPFYLSCPASDLSLFKRTIGSDGILFVSDEDIILANPALDQRNLNKLPGYLSQQIVKSEFWRLNACLNYLCIDSDSYFLREFGRDIFLAPDGHPYTVINESLELRLFGALYHHAKIARDIDTDCNSIMNIFERSGRHYDFGPLPVVWSRKVWNDLAEKFLEPRGMNFYDAIKLFPSEMRWYGEALLKYRSIELWPVETFFRCYHYEDQYRAAIRTGENNEILKQVYLGICSQSNWDKDLDFGAVRKSLLSRLVRETKRRIFRRLT